LTEDEGGAERDEEDQRIGTDRDGSGGDDDHGQDQVAQ